MLHLSNTTPEVDVSQSPEALREQALRYLALADKIESLPEDNFENGVIVNFTKRFGRNHGGIEYEYVALKARDKWYVTGRQLPYPITWSELLEFIGHDNLDSVYVVTEVEPL